MLLDKCTDFILKYCIALKKTGANGVVMAEPAAGLMSDDDCMRFSSVYVKRIVEAVQDDNFTVVLHNCGNTGQCTKCYGGHRSRRISLRQQVRHGQVSRQVPPTALTMATSIPSVCSSLPRPTRCAAPPQTCCAR